LFFDGSDRIVKEEAARNDAQALIRLHEAEEEKKRGNQ
jgi:hypothetical protein